MQNDKLSAKLVTVALICALGIGGAVGRALGHLQDTAAVAASEPKVAAGQKQPEKRYAVPVTGSQPSIGPEDAVVTIVEWCDLPDEGCAALEPKVQQLLKANAEMTRLVFRHYPTEKPFSTRAHEFAAIAHKNAGKLWEARALLLGHKGELTDADLERVAGQLGLDWEATKKALDAHDFASGVRADQLFATMFDLHNSPGVFINGRSLGEHPTAAQLEEVFNEEGRHAIEMVVGGVDKAQVYAKLTDKGAFTPFKRRDP